MQTIDYPIPADLVAWIERLSRVELAAGETLPLFAGARVHLGFVVSGSVFFSGSELTWHKEQAACLGAITQAGETAVAGAEGVDCFLVKLAGGVAPGVIGHSAEMCTDRILPLQLLWPKVTPVTPLCSLSSFNAFNSLDSRMAQRQQLDAIFAALRCAIAHFEAHLVWRPNQSLRTMQLLDSLSVDAAAKALAMSRATFERHVRKLFGITPKKLSRIQRFYRALAALSRSGKDFVSVELGYFDQSHMIAEFRDFTQLTPLGVIDIAARRPDSIRLYETFAVDGPGPSQPGSSRQR